MAHLRGHAEELTRGALEARVGAAAGALHERREQRAGRAAAVRALGLDCGPMGGFNKAMIDNTFYKDSSWRSNFLMNIGYGDETQLHPRGHRLSFDDACSIL